MASPMVVRGWFRSLLAGSALTAMATLGCGTGEYNNRLQTTVNNVSRRAAIEAFLAPSPTDVGSGVGVSLRLPTAFAADAKPVPPGEPRAKIGNVGLPGLISATERFIDDGAGKNSVHYVYFAAVQKEGKPQDVLQAEVQRAIAATLPNAKWETANIEKLTGGSASYPVLKASGPQIFDATQNGGQSEQLEGQLELYLVPTDKHWVLIGWRAPTAHATKYQFWDAVRASMATVATSAGGAAPAAPEAAPAAAPAGAAPADPMPMPMPAANNALPQGAGAAAAGIAPIDP